MVNEILKFSIIPANPFTDFKKLVNLFNTSLNFRLQRWCYFCPVVRVGHACIQFSYFRLCNRLQHYDRVIVVYTFY